VTDLGTIFARVILNDLVLRNTLISMVTLGLVIVALGNIGIGYIGMLIKNQSGWVGALVAVRFIQGLG